jgi:hypothetical protein
MGKLGLKCYAQYGGLHDLYDAHHLKELIFVTKCISVRAFPIFMGDVMPHFIL